MFSYTQKDIKIEERKVTDEKEREKEVLIGIKDRQASKNHCWISNEVMEVVHLFTLLINVKQFLQTFLNTCTNIYVKTYVYS